MKARDVPCKWRRPRRSAQLAAMGPSMERRPATTPNRKAERKGTVTSREMDTSRLDDCGAMFSYYGGCGHPPGVAPTKSLRMIIDHRCIMQLGECCPMVLRACGLTIANTIFRFHFLLH